MAGLLDYLGFGGAPMGGGLLGGLGRNSDSLLGFGMGMLGGENQQAGFSNALTGMQRGELLDKSRAKDAKAEADLQARKKAYADWAASNPEAAKYAPLIAANPELGDKIVTAQATRNPLDDAYKRAQIEALNRKAAGKDASYGLNPLFGERTNPDGTTTVVPLQVSDAGGVREAQLPDGVKLARGIEKLDAGTYWSIRDKQTGQEIGRQPKDIAGKEQAEVEGKAQGQAKVNLPDAVATTDRMLTQIEQVKAHPGKSWGTGITSFGNGIPGTDQFDFQQRVNQLKGGTFLQAYNTLRGAGAITDIEGKKAEDAIARLNTGLRGKDFDTALDDLADVLRAGKQRMAQKAGVAPGQPAQAGQSSGAAGGRADPLGIR